MTPPQSVIFPVARGGIERNWWPLPGISRLSFHPTLARVLERRPGAAAEFRAWGTQLVERCKGVDNICTAHARRPPDSAQGAGRIAVGVKEALTRVERVLGAHQARYG